MNPNPWLVVAKPLPQARMRLFCLPYAGGGTAVYNRWHRYLPDTIELVSLRLPGRENRLMERPFTNLNDLLPELGAALADALDKPFALFGHSMGAMIAFELTRWLRREKRPLPQRLMVSGFRAPHLPPNRPPIHHLPNAEFLAEVKLLGGTPQAVLEHEELLGLLLPLLRADFTLVGTYAWGEERPLTLPITAFGTADDPIATPAQLGAWQQHTTAVCAVHLFPGDHFYLHGEGEALVGRVVEEVLGDWRLGD